MSALDPDVGENLTKELNATLHARRDLGPEYESELIDSFLDKIGRRIDGQVERRVRREIAEQQMTDARAGFRGCPHRERHGGGWRDMRLAVVSLVLAIPLSGIGATTAGVPGLLVTWAGIVGVNVAQAMSQRESRRESPERRETDASPW